MKTSKNKIESSTDDGKLLTLIDRNILDYQTNSKKSRDLLNPNRSLAKKWLVLLEIRQVQY